MSGFERVDFGYLGAITFSEGRGAAAEVDAWLSNGSTRLPSTGGIKARASVHRSCDVILANDLENRRLCHLRASWPRVRKSKCNYVKLWTELASHLEVGGCRADQIICYFLVLRFYLSNQCKIGCSIVDLVITQSCRTRVVAAKSFQHLKVPTLHSRSGGIYNTSARTRVVGTVYC